jgi:hypothetical protein
MDIVLEAFDTFLFDPIYATLLPGNAPALVSNNASSSRDISFGISNTSWEYVPASQYLSFEPRKYAYMSCWSRDDWRRQLLNLYFITWYAHRYLDKFTKIIDLKIQDLWRFHLLRLRHAVVRLHLRQGHLQASKVHQEPDSPGDASNQYRATYHGSSHSSVVFTRDSRLLEDV